MPRESCCFKSAGEAIGGVADLPAVTHGQNRASQTARNGDSREQATLTYRQPIPRTVAPHVTKFPAIPANKDMHGTHSVRHASPPASKHNNNSVKHTLEAAKIKVYPRSHHHHRCVASLQPHFIGRAPPDEASDRNPCLRPASCTSSFRHSIATVPARRTFSLDSTWQTAEDQVGPGRRKSGR